MTERTWRERVDRVKAAIRGDGGGLQPDGSWVLDDRLVNMNLFSKEAIQARRELEREGGAMRTCEGMAMPPRALSRPPRA